MGTPEFAVPTLEFIHKRIGIKAVVTVPDKPQGRGLKLKASPVKEKALELKIPVLQPESLKDENFIKELKDLSPDIIVVIAFRILPPQVYNLARIGTFNVHASLLPKYRGAAPINWAIINGDEETGLTSFLIQEKVDTGDILLQQRIKIEENMTAGELHDKLMNIAPQFTLDTCNLLFSGKYFTQKQDNSQVTSAPKIHPDFCKINWQNDARTIRNFIHGLSPYPGAWTLWNEKRLKILKVEYCQCGTGETASFTIGESFFNVQCAKGIISITHLQLEGRNPMPIKDFINGFRGEKYGKFS
jgi:methionyl-tRNA formyltransferase